LFTDQKKAFLPWGLIGEPDTTNPFRPRGLAGPVGGTMSLVKNDVVIAPAGDLRHAEVGLIPVDAIG
jgi:hypothetical protein